MKLSDYVAEALAVRHGVKDIFLVSGGGIMHLLDSFGARDDMRYICTYHEQAAVVAAEGYARRSGRLGVALVTVGPGAANAVSALPGAWVDSIPLLVLAGQVRADLIADYRTQRQKGPQEANTLDMARPVTKYAASIGDPKTIKTEIDKAIHIATSGRPGPVWLEFPVDVTALDVDPKDLVGWLAPQPAYTKPQYIRGRAREVADAIGGSQRPLWVVGNGVRLGGAERELSELISESGIPAVVPFTAKDLLPEDEPKYIGVFGSAGQRRANFAIQNADLLIGLGAGFNVQKTGFNIRGFAPHAKKVVVDIDEVQLHEQTLKPDIAIQADVKTFIPALTEELRGCVVSMSPRWLEACAQWKARYPLITPDYYEDGDHVNSYLFMDALSEVMSKGDTLVTGAGLDVVSTYQAFRVKGGQRVLISGWGSMGWDLPMSIGAALAGGSRVITVTGDGSFQWNSQELLTIQRYGIPIKMFVFNNAGFSSIRATQNSLFEGRYVGADFTSGVATANFARLAQAYDMPYARIDRNSDLAGTISSFLSEPGAGICEVFLATEQSVSPKASAFRRADGTLESRPLEDMAPFLPREEIYENMHLFEGDAVSAYS